jgi:hypothetical protein
MVPPEGESLVGRAATSAGCARGPADVTVDPVLPAVREYDLVGQDGFPPGTDLLERARPCSSIRALRDMVVGRPPASFERLRAEHQSAPRASAS